MGQDNAMCAPRGLTVVGLSAKMGCGKTTLFHALANMAQGFDVVVRRAFGDLLKQECASYFGFPLDLCYSQEGKDAKIYTMYNGRVIMGKTVRELLQWYGTEYRRGQDPDYWTKAMRKELTLMRETRILPTLVVIDDVRFPDEAQVCLEQGYCFRIEPYPTWQPGPHAEHSSETALDNFEGFTDVFRPDLGLEELRFVAEKILWRVSGQGKELLG